ncbi:MAG TPA: hypothetical protein VNZ52_11215 [Candidatus Thermoplasmatota archaeon]|nr:hypothetical protein [Candidatus Thermoplasmatota archaeon]
MSLLMNALARLKGSELVVVMSDTRAYRGVLVDFDNEVLILKDVKESSSANLHGWEEPTVSTGIIHKTVNLQGIFSQEDKDAEIVRFKDVIIRLTNVIRIWEWGPQNFAKPEHVTIEKAKVRPGAPRTASAPNRDF